MRCIDSKKMGKADHGWLNSHFHFSFDQYRNPSNMNFGVLRVLNDDLVQPGTGFDLHPHQDMEIVSYVVDGELTHKDSMGNERTLTRGQIQYMSAGTGVVHSEYNEGASLLRFLQIWILPDKKGYKPAYGDYAFPFGDRIGRWLPLASYYDGDVSDAPVKIHADVSIYAGVIEAGRNLAFAAGSGRQAYLVNIEGETAAGSSLLYRSDALEITEEEVTLESKTTSHLLVIEMKKA
ncbi:MAG: pirin family protein [Synergistaceae bacterium]|nr:pirin family protein [Synergistaceae bacterium]